ncbi:MAG TPA: response regulator [Soehngenia sp.]|nr:response regulator [Soehngenia sp.]
MIDYVVFSCDNIEDDLVDELNKMGIKSIFVDAKDLLKAVKLLNPIALVTNDGKLNTIDGIEDIQIPIFVLSNDQLIKENAKSDNFYILRQFYPLDLLNSLKLIKQSAHSNIYSFNSNIYRRDIGESILMRLLKNKIASLKNSFLLITKFIDTEEHNNMQIWNKDLYDNIDYLFSIHDYFNKPIFNYRVDTNTFASLYSNLDIKNFIKNLQNTILKFYNSTNINHDGIKVKFKVIEVSSINAEEIKDYYEFSKEDILKDDIITQSNVKKSYKILFVDEDKVVLNILKSRYLNKGYEVISFDNLLDCLNFLETTEVDAIITELYTKNMNADDFLMKLNELEINTPVIILSSQKNESSVKRLLNLGAVDYIYKPFSPIELDARLEKLLD